MSLLRPGSFMNRALVARFSPASLFAAGEQGAWYDPSDFSTMFQNSAGTTPVTAVEQPVGLLLDKSKGLALGAELVGATWTCSDATWSQTGSTLTAVNGTSFSCYQSIITAGTWYKVSFEIFDYASGSVSVRLGNAGAPAGFSASANGTYTAIGLGVGDTTFYWMGVGTFNGKIRNISVKALPGNHASQSTAASRPVLSARVNLLTYSEQFDNAAWTQALVTPTSNTTTAPNGTLTADTAAFGASANARISQSITTVSVPYTFSVWLKADSAQSIRIGNVLGALSTVSVTTEWQQFSYTFTPSAGANGIGLQNASDALSRSVYVWGADLRVTNVGSNMPAYQRVGAATYGTSTVAGNPDYDTSGFPLFLAFNGSTGSRWMVSSTITPGTDKAQVFAGVRKLGDTVGVISEFSAEINSNSGAFIVNNYTDLKTYFASKGTAYQEVGGTAIAAPFTEVFTGLGDISAPLVSARENGALSGSKTASQGTGNYLSYPLYIGARAGTISYYNGNLYSLIVRFGPNLPESTIDQTEVWVGDKTGLNLNYATQQTIFDRFNATVLDRLSAIILQRY